MIIDLLSLYSCSDTFKGVLRNKVSERGGEDGEGEKYPGPKGVQGGELVYSK